MRNDNNLIGANIFVCMICLFILACNSSSQNDHESDLKRRAAQLREDKEKAQKFEEDKRLQNRIDSLAAIAWGDALFGMTREELKKTRAFGKGNYSGTVLEMDYDRKKETIKTFRFKHLSFIRVSFFNDVLNGVYIDSEKVGPNEFDELCADLVNIKTNFNRIYDSPKKTNKVSFNNFDQNGRQMVAEYEIKGPNIGLTKNINIELRKNNYDYWYSITIYNSCIDRNKQELFKWIKKFNERDVHREDVELYSF